MQFSNRKDIQLQLRTTIPEEEKQQQQQQQQQQTKILGILVNLCNLVMAENA